MMTYIRLASPYGGTITFTGALPAGAVDVNVRFKFERLPFNADDATATEPSFFTEYATVTGTDEAFLYAHHWRTR